MLIVNEGEKKSSGRRSGDLNVECAGFNLYTAAGFIARLFIVETCLLVCPCVYSLAMYL